MDYLSSIIDELNDNLLAASKYLQAIDLQRGRYCDDDDCRCCQGNFKVGAGLNAVMPVISDMEEMLRFLNDKDTLTRVLDWALVEQKHNSQNQ